MEFRLNYFTCYERCALAQATVHYGWRYVEGGSSEPGTYSSLEELLELWFVERHNPFSYPEFLIREYQCLHEFAYENMYDDLTDIAVTEHGDPGDNSTGVMDMLTDDTELCVDLLYERVSELSLPAAQLM